MVARTAKFAVSELSITRRRGRRSATTPPTSSVEICASVQHANAIPTSVAEPVRSRTANATAIGARFVPKNEIVRAPKSRRKFRTLSGPSSSRTTLLPIPLQAGVRLPEGHRALVGFGITLPVCVQLVPNRVAELRFRYAGSDERHPVHQAPAQLGEVA